MKNAYFSRSQSFLLIFVVMSCIFSDYNSSNKERWKIRYIIHFLTIDCYAFVTLLHSLTSPLRTISSFCRLYKPCISPPLICEFRLKCFPFSSSSIATRTRFSCNIKMPDDMTIRDVITCLNPLNKTCCSFDSLI